MFFSVLIPDLKIVARSQWEGRGRNTQCKLRILATQEAVRKLLDQLSEGEAAELAKHLPGLKESGPEPFVEVEGNAAASLSSFIAKYANNVAGYQHVPRAEELMGFWEPPDEGAPGEGIIMWSDRDVNYHVAVVHSKEQAERLIDGFQWLEKTRQTRLLEKIKQWNAQQSSTKNEQRIDGIIAKLLCRASIVTKVVQ